MTLDPNLKEYATPRQWELLEAVEEHGSVEGAAAAFDLSRGTITNTRKAVMAKAARAGYSPEHALNRPFPDGYTLGKVTIQENPRTGEIERIWPRMVPDKERQHEMFLAAIEGFKDEIPRAEPIPEPKGITTNLMVGYPISDHHLGMLSWGEETTDDYDLDIGEKLLRGAIQNLTAASPSTDHGLVAFMGDFLHYDSFETVTPKNRNQLDSDTRFPKVVRAAIRGARFVIDTALMRHKHVHVIVEIGNHDLSSSIFLMECLAALYENEPRVSVDTNPSHFHYYQHGHVLIGTHHGHGPKMDKLPLIMATDNPVAWGETKYRYWWTGHVHHDQAKNFQVKDHPGVKVESFRIMPPADAYAHNEGFRTMRDLKAILYHPQHGEVGRNIVNPDMLR